MAKATSMTITQLRTTIEHMGLSRTALGRFLGHPDGRTVRKWLAGDYPIPVTTAKLLRLMVKLDLDPSQVD